MCSEYSVCVRDKQRGEGEEKGRNRLHDNSRSTLDVEIRFQIQGSTNGSLSARPFLMNHVANRSCIG